MHEKRHFLSYRKRRHNAKIICTYAHYVTLGSRCKMASSSYEDEADTYPEKPRRTQPYQFEPIIKAYQFASERVPEHRVSSRIARIGNTDWQVSHFPHHRWSCTGRPFVLRWVDWSVSFDRFCFCFCFFHSAAWSNMTDPWQNFREAEFYIFLCTPIEIIIIYYFQGCEWLNHLRVTICFM